jgi:hypothetical protein
VLLILAGHQLKDVDNTLYTVYLKVTFYGGVMKIGTLLAILFGILVFPNLSHAQLLKNGEDNPIAEIIEFSSDSLYSEFIGDTVNCYIRNNSDSNVILDSIFTGNSYGYLSLIIDGSSNFFINLFGSYPNHPLDTLRYNIPANDSILFQIYDVDLCPLCDFEIQDYFLDTLTFGFTIVDSGLYFTRAIQISGEGHPSALIDFGDPPSSFNLSQNYPNPFNPTTKISWQSPISSWQTIKVYDILGNLVSTLVDEFKPAGSYEVNFYATSLSSGIYFYQMRVGEFIETKRMVLLK